VVQAAFRRRCYHRASSACRCKLSSENGAEIDRLQLRVTNSQNRG
jgi:hypothetical protein